ncbi:hypothetical protein FHS29_000200 [Saccharothrix tamanrassetensis]|uniref:Uncharacterized protein n=1 Tax=Saccharothrix tamanrassetensis TaxID=1051531 RepID=A0A841C9J5_9PSEU|nr:hypothetical protein [Saccharothrix tamanrassetensis]MBB5953630.1 hypothetical protein [Saccharothrix tamanrassetensis]
MTAENRVGRPSYADAAAALAGHVLEALGEGSPAHVAGFLDSCAEHVAGLGAVRLVGADVFAPQLLLGSPLETRDVDAVADAFDAFPPVHRPATREQHVMAWRDWTTTRLLTRLADGPSPAPGTAQPVADTPGDPVDVLGPAEQWQRWSVAVAQLSMLALPGADGPVVEAVSGEPLALARGTTRAVLRRDHATAARLARWVALLRDIVPLDPVALVEHLRLHAGNDARLLLDLAVARHLAKGT